MSEFVVYAKHDDPDNNMVIHCHDMREMDKCARECIKQGYREVYTKVAPKSTGKTHYCPRCGWLVGWVDEGEVDKECECCGQLLELGQL